MLPEWITKFFSVKLATLLVSLWFIREVDCDPSLKLAALAGVSAVFIVAKTVQNILLGDKEVEVK